MAFRPRARALARMLGALASAAERLARRWWPEGSDETKPPTGASDPHPTHPPTPAEAEAPNLIMQDLARVTRGFAGPKSTQKWLNQMNKRGWTPEQVEEAIAGGRSFPASNRINPENGATRYVHPQNGRSIVIDSKTGEVI